MKVHATLWNHQQQMLDFALNAIENGVSPDNWTDPFHGCLELAGCATGKTLFSFKLMETIQAKKTLILTTKAGIPSAWHKEHAKWTEGLEMIAPITGSVAKKAEQLVYNGGSMCYVTNYEASWRMAGEIKAFAFDLVIADESHKLQAYNSKVSKTMARALFDVPAKIAMTGTAWDNKPTQVYGQARFLAPKRSGSHTTSAIFGSYQMFERQYVTFTRLPDGTMIPVGFQNQGRLGRIMDSFTFYVDSEEVLDLPEYQDITREIKLTGDVKRAYKQLEKDMVAELGKDLLIADNRLVQSLRLHQLARGHSQFGNFVEPNKNPYVQATLDILDEIGSEPTVIFTRFSADVDALKQELTRKGFDVKLLVGGQHEHVEFQNGSGDILIANMSAGSESVELTRASYCIYYSKGHSRSTYNQSRYRVRRTTSERPITFFHLVGIDTVDEDIELAMTKKGKVADYLLTKLTARVKP